MDIIPGDRIRCKILDDRIVSNSNQVYDSIREFEVLYKDNDDPLNCGYYVYVPQFYGLMFVTKVTLGLIVNRNINKRFLDCDYTFIRDYHIFDIQQKNDGSICDHCKEWFMYAARIDNKFVCYSCRENPYR